jgi:hypothetical protein
MTDIFHLASAIMQRSAPEREASSVLSRALAMSTDIGLTCPDAVIRRLAPRAVGGRAVDRVTVRSF